MGQLDSKVVIVTGSDSGIGRGIAIEMAQEGATVVVVYAHAQAKAQEVLETIQKNNGKAIVIQADVSQYDQAMGLIQQTVEQLGRLDILVNNAGIEHHNAFLDVTEQEFDRVLSVDLKGAFFCAQAAARAMVKSKTVDASSTSRQSTKTSPCRTTPPIAVRKAGYVCLHAPSAMNWPSTVLRSTTLHRERFLRRLMLMWRQTRRSWKRFLPKFPFIAGGSLKRSGKLAVFLASEAAAYVTGSTYVMDGGLSVYAGAL